MKKYITLLVLISIFVFIVLPLGETKALETASKEEVTKQGKQTLDKTLNLWESLHKNLTEWWENQENKVINWFKKEKQLIKKELEKEKKEMKESLENKATEILLNIWDKIKGAVGLN